MPELPDVEIFRRRLARSGLHRRIADVQIRDSRMLRHDGGRDVERTLRGRSLEATHRRGKHLIVDLSDGGVLALHFGMTGYLTAEDGESIEEHARMVVELDDGPRLRFVDQRRLGWIALADTSDDYVAREGLGPDALALTPAELRNVMRDSRGSVKATLTDQGRIAGLGNIYADEVLFQARVDPRASACDLDPAAYRRLHRQLRRVAELAIDRGADPDRLPRTWLLPHREEGTPCPRGRGTVRRYRSGGRTGYHCPTCQCR